nr:DUF3006 domain-containing protein [Enterocloster clostridioformis]
MRHSVNTVSYPTPTERIPYMKYIIDRLEEGLAICETELRKRISVPVSHLPKGIKEGDVLREEEGRFSLDSEETDKRRREMKKKLMDLFE